MLMTKTQFQHSNEAPQQLPHIFMPSVIPFMSSTVKIVPILSYGYFNLIPGDFLSNTFRLYYPKENGGAATDSLRPNGVRYLAKNITEALKWKHVVND